MEAGSASSMHLETSNRCCQPPVTQRSRLWQGSTSDLSSDGSWSGMARSRLSDMSSSFSPPSCFSASCPKVQSIRRMHAQWHVWNGIERIAREVECFYLAEPRVKVHCSWQRFDVQVPNTDSPCGTTKLRRRRNPAYRYQFGQLPDWRRISPRHPFLLCVFPHNPT